MAENYRAPLTFRARSIPVERARRFWKKIARGLQYECRMLFPDGSDVSFEINTAIMGPCTLTNVTLPIHTLIRSAGDIQQDGHKNFSVYYIPSGQADFVQGARVCIVESGECLLVDHSVPHERRFISPSSLIGLHIPRAVIASLLPYPENMAFQLIRPEGWGQALAAAMRQLRTDCIHKLPLPAEMITTQIISLLALALRPSASPMKSGRVCVLGRVRQCMAVRLHDSELTPERVAGEVGISKRMLHALFAETDSTFGVELIGMRLNRARSLLEDERFHRHSIAEIAQLSGFLNASHFGRRFKDTHGMPPAVYRSLVQDQAR